MALTKEPKWVNVVKTAFPAAHFTEVSVNQLGSTGGLPKGREWAIVKVGHDGEPVKRLHKMGLRREPPSVHALPLDAVYVALDTLITCDAVAIWHH